MSTTLANVVNGNGAPKTSPEVAAKINLIRTLQGELDNAIPPAIKKVLTPDRMTRLAVTAMRQVKNLDKCTYPSIAGALMVAAQLGLEPCTPLQHCYLIPRKNGRTKEYEATFQLGYQGMLDLAYRTETVKSVTAKAVFLNDEFVYEEGLEDRLIHRPRINGDRGPIIAYYAVIKFINGGHAFDVASADEMVAHMDRFAPRDYETNRITGPWVSDFDEMAKKTMIRRLFKYMRKSTDIVAKAVLYDDRVVDRDASTAELRPQFEEQQPRAQIQAPQHQQLEDQGEDIEAEAVETPVEPEPAQAAKVPRKRQPAQQAQRQQPAQQARPDPEPEPEAPFDNQPAHDTTVRQRPPAQQTQQTQPAKPVESKPNVHAQTVAAIEKWFGDATLMHESDGLSELANRDALMDRIYEIYARNGQVNPEIKPFFSRAGELAKLLGSPAAAESSLRSVNKIVRDEYAGVPDDTTIPVKARAADPDQNGIKAPGLKQAEKVAAVEKWITDAAATFDTKGYPWVMPSGALAEFYKRAANDGMVDPSLTQYRSRIIEFANLEMSFHDLTQKLAGYARQMMSEIDSQREPGANG